MNEAQFFYTFFFLMTFNLLASLVYLVGFNQMKLAVKKALKPQKPR